MKTLKERVIELCNKSDSKSVMLGRFCIKECNRYLKVTAGREDILWDFLSKSELREIEKEVKKLE